MFLFQFRGGKKKHDKPERRDQGTLENKALIKMSPSIQDLCEHKKTPDCTKRTQGATCFDYLKRKKKRHKRHKF